VLTAKFSNTIFRFRLGGPEPMAHSQKLLALYRFLFATAREIFPAQDKNTLLESSFAPLATHSTPFVGQ
jgi:hypothetical protein